MKRFVAAVAALAVAAAGCSKSGEVSSTGKNAWTKPHVLRYATSEDINTLNPLFSQQTTISLLSSLTAAWLVKWDAQNLPQPEIATTVPTQANGGVSKDGLTVTYHLRHDVKWSDGVPLTADDVVWTTQHAVMNMANDVTSRAGWDQIAKVDEPDKYTVIYHLRKPFSPFVVVFFSSAGGNPSILPKHLLERYPNINNVPFNSLPVGAGPFKYKAWDRSQRVVMVPNPYYFRGRPKLQQVVFAIVPDRDTILTQLQTKELDMWYPIPGRYLPRVSQLEGFKVLRQPAYLFNHYDFNLARPAMKDVAVRKALRLAVDRDTILRKLGNGVGIRQEQPAPKVAPYYDAALPLAPFDIAQANRILDTAGWKLGPDGVRSKNGVKLDLEFATSSGSQDVDNQIELLRSWWKQIGVAITVRHYPANTLFSPYGEGGILQTGKFDVAIYGSSDDPIGDFSSSYACDQIPPKGQNVLHWCDAQADAAQHDLYGHFDQTRRNADDRILFERLDATVPTVVTSGREDIYAFNSDLVNFKPNAVTPFDAMMNVDI